MSQAVMDILKPTIQKTMGWLEELKSYLGCDDQPRTYSILRVVLHTLRDRLTAQEAAHLGAQLPMLIRGMYYEGWRPDAKPVKLKTQEDFLAYICGQFPRGCDFDPELATRAVFKLLTNRIARGEIEDIRQNFPRDLADWWK